MTKKIIGAVVSSILNWVKSWYAQERVKADAWNTRALKAMLESVKDADKLSVKIRESEAVGFESPRAWNKVIVIMLLVAVFVSGCIVRTVYVETKMPLIGRPDRPVLKEFRPFTEREQKLVIYAATMEAQIDAYNQAARVVNSKNGYGE